MKEFKYDPNFVTTAAPDPQKASGYQWPSAPSYHGGCIRNIDAAPVMAEWAKGYSQERKAFGENFGFSAPAPAFARMGGLV